MSNRYENNPATIRGEARKRPILKDFRVFVFEIVFVIFVDFFTWISLIFHENILSGVCYVKKSQGILLKTSCDCNQFIFLIVSPVQSFASITTWSITVVLGFSIRLISRSAAVFPICLVSCIMVVSFGSIIREIVIPS